MADRYQQIVTLDFETYFSQTYSLKNKELNTSEYIRHPEFKTQCVGIQIGDKPVSWFRDRDVEAAIRDIDWSNSALLCHHTAFDGLILGHHYGVVPSYYLDTLSMGRALHSNTIGASLETLANFYRLGNKLPNVLDKTKGIRELPDELMQQLGQYCALDTVLCRMLFDKMKVNFPQNELDLIDMTLRMFCDPILRIDMDRVKLALQQEQEQRAQTIAMSGVDLKTLSSAEKFADALWNVGIHAPRKISPTTGKETWAFSKTDLEFMALTTHSDERVRKLATARLAAKSTIGESRAGRFLEAGKDGQRLPVYLSYYGAHTGRWSGGNKMNMQNLKRGGELRRSILAPEGHVIVVADSAQIEARMTAWLAGDTELLDLFAAGADPYKHMAASIYTKEVADVTSDERFVGKVAILGLGYGMGAEKFQHTLATGAMGPPMFLTSGQCREVVNKYRSERYRIVAVWRAMDRMLFKMMRGQPMEWHAEILRLEGNKLYMPNGMFLHYPFLDATWDNVNDRFVEYRYYEYTEGIKKKFGIPLDPSKGKKIYGGLATENLVQALARIAVGEQMLDIKNQLVETPGKYRRVVTMTHDEVVVVVPEEEGQMTFDIMKAAMTKPPAWCADLPMNADGGFAKNYSK